MTKRMNNANVLVIAGSIRRPSYTRALVCAVGAVLEQEGARVVEWDLVTNPLPIADPEYDGIPEQYPDDNVRLLAKLAGAANAFVLGSPVYHNSYTGVLKNALDLLGSAQFERKPVGLLAHKGVQPLDHLRIVMRSIRAPVITAQIATLREHYAARDGDYFLVDQRVLKRVELFAQELLDWVELFAPITAPTASSESTINTAQPVSNNQ